MSTIRRDISKQKNWMAERSKLSSRPSSVGIKMEKIKYDPKRIEARKKKRCCGR